MALRSYRKQKPNGIKQSVLNKVGVSGSLETWLQKRIAFMKKKQSDAVDLDKKKMAGIKLKAYKECLHYIVTHQQKLIELEKKV